MARKLLFILTFVLLAAGLVLAQEAGELEKLFAKVRREAASKTVLVRNKVPGTKREVSGSGALISPDGLVLTCSHVLRDRESLKVVFSDGREFKAKLLGQNYVNDYALLKIEAKDLPCFELGDSGELKEGQPVMALGYPGGQCKDGKPWISYGKVVALNRKVPVQGFERFYPNAIKTGVKSVPGNSGGPLVTGDGKLVGINGAVMIFMDRTYAIPIDAIKESLPALKAGKDVEGIKVKSYSELLKELQDEFTPEELKKFYEELGRRLKNLEPQKMLERFKKFFGDEVDIEKAAKELEKLFEGARDNLSGAVKRLFGEEGFRELQKELEELFKDKEALKEVGRQVEEAFRKFGKLFGGGEEEERPEKEKPAKEEGAEPPEGEELDREIKRMLDLLKKRLDEREKEEKEKTRQEEVKKKVEKMLDEALGTRLKERPEPDAQVRPYLGLTLAKMGDALRYQLNLKGGLLVDRVRPDSPAARAGLRTGDIVLKVGGKSVASFADVEAVLEGKKPGDRLTLTVITKGSQAEVEIELEVE